jgi:hypothetical protein
MATWDELKALLGVGAEEQSPIPQTVATEAPIPLTTERPMRLEGGTAPPPMIQEPKIDPASLRQNMQPAPEPIVEPATPKLRDYEREAIDDKNSFSNKLLEALIGGLAGAGGRGIGEITNARMIRENSKLREAKQMNLRSPDSQISGHFRELAKMYSDPKEFTVTPQMSAEDIMEAMPWLKDKIGLDMSQQKLDYSTRPRTGGGGVKIKPLSNPEQDKISMLRMTVGMAENLIDKFNSPEFSQYIGVLSAPYESVKQKLNVGDPNFAALETALDDFAKQYMASIEGGKPSDYDAITYKKLIGRLTDQKGSLNSKLNYFRNKAAQTLSTRLNDAERNYKDISGFRDLIKDNAPTAPKGAKAEPMVKVSLNGKIGEIPVSKLKDFMKKYPNAKRVK